MREIKFDYIIRADDSSLVHCPYTLNQLEQSAKLEEMRTAGKVLARREFTGLKDKNGVEIYEGDIVQYVDYAAWDKSTNGKVPRRRAVEWQQSYIKCGWNISGRGESYEVIGNIYENPELLEESA